MVDGAWYGYIAVWKTCGLLDVLLGACGYVVGCIVGCIVGELVDVLLGACGCAVGELVGVLLGKSRWAKSTRDPR